ALEKLTNNEMERIHTRKEKIEEMERSTTFLEDHLQIMEGSLSITKKLIAVKEKELLFIEDLANKRKELKKGISDSDLSSDIKKVKMDLQIEIEKIRQQKADEEKGLADLKDSISLKNLQKNILLDREILIKEKEKEI